MNAFSSASDSKCDSEKVGNGYFKLGKTYYKYHDMPMSWSEANATCSADGETVLSLKNNSDSLFFANIFYSRKWGSFQLPAKCRKRKVFLSRTNLA